MFFKVERTGKGDATRWLKGFGAGFFTCFNRNKKSIAIDLKSEKGEQILLEIISRVDVLVENFGPGTVERLGVGWDVCRERNPRLIYCRRFGRSAAETRRVKLRSEAPTAGHR